MNVLIISAHPEPRSFNGALVDITVSRLKAIGHQVEVGDLYQERFDPVERAEHYASRGSGEPFAPLDEQRAHHDRQALPKEITRELARLEWAELVVFHFPLWWHAQPAILKGWFDRVMVYGGRYTSRMRYDQGYFQGKRALLCVTAGSPEPAFQPFGRAGDMAAWLWPMHASLYYVGFDVLAPQVSYGVQGGGIEYQGKAALREHLEGCKRRWAERLPGLSNEATIPFAGWGDWNEQGVLKETSPLRWRLG
ncbi:NAD(P)H-dependent oxidoreductase [Halomonas sp. PAMB 3232]|uniref:NAD(P)H-dependent oxidoreductase n=1 Tax=Halomonas sp. PAMB 3232 TaxID=3075221 RepID=UPI00289FEC30|nr:NAD(P)H-dependent oxidoreductase [Halomonas sp. PAMB 3232]WNL39940.1 NAD(P)H-dependent oxidoreductase [Halomonas sp. PAMB 3232]